MNYLQAVKVKIRIHFNFKNESVDINLKKR